jgi:DNA-binding response OmpR family regulator
VLALTAHALAGDKERALQAGCADYHTKPVDFAKLLAQMEAILQKRSANSPGLEGPRSADVVAGDKPQ